MSQRAVLSALCVFVTLCLSGGQIQGWGPLYNMLVDEGQYRELCAPEAEAAAAATVGVTLAAARKTCAAQEDALQDMQDAGFTALSAGSVIAGLMIDAYGPRLPAVLGLLVVGAGCVLMAISESKTFDAFVPGFCLIAGGGVAPYLGHMNVGALFGVSRHALFISIICAAFNMAGFLYIIPQHLHITRRDFFLGEAVLAGAMAVLGAFLYADRAYIEGDTKPEFPLSRYLRACGLGGGNGSSGGRGTRTPLMGRGGAGDRASLSPKRYGLNGDEGGGGGGGGGGGDGFEGGATEDGDPYNSDKFISLPRAVPTAGGGGGGAPVDDLRNLPPKWKQYEHEHHDVRHVPPSADTCTRMRAWAEEVAPHLRDPQLLLLLAWYSYTLLVVTFVGGAIPDIMHQLHDTGVYANDVYPTVGNMAFLFNPVIGLFLGRGKFGWWFVACNISSMAVLLLCLVPVLPLQALTCLLFALQKGILFAAFFAFIALEFPADLTGTLVAVCTAGAAVVGLGSLALVPLVQDVLGGSYSWVNTGLAAACVPLFALPAIVIRRERLENAALRAAHLVEDSDGSP